MSGSDERAKRRGILAAKIIDPGDAIRRLAIVRSVLFGQSGRLLVARPVDPTGLDDSIVAKIDTAIQSGLGAMLIMGASLSSPEQWNESAISKLLPGRVTRQWRRPITDRSIFLRNVNPRHPVWSEFGSEVTNIPWNRYPIFKYWSWRDLPTVRRSSCSSLRQGILD